MKKQILIPILLLYAGFAFSYNIIPNVSSSSRGDYQAGRQNWDIDIDSHGIVYFANTDGLLCNIYGEWLLKKVKSETTIRSVYADNDTIWVGGNEYGYFTKDEQDELSYHHLDDLDVGQVWNIERYRNAIYLQTEHLLLKYDKTNHKVESHYYEDGLWGMIEWKGQLWTILRHGQIGTLTGFEFEEKEQFPELGSKEVRRMYVHNDLLFIVMLDGRLFHYDGKKLSAVKLPKEMKGETLFTAMSYSENNYCLGSISSGFFQLNNQHQITQRVNSEEGLIDNTVLSMKTDEMGNVWLGLDYGIAKIELQNSINKIFNNGATYHISNLDESTYLSTNKGLYRSVNEKPFYYVHKTSGQVWRTRIIDGQLYICHNNGLMILDANAGKLIYNETGLMDIARFGSSDYYLFSTYIGVLLMKRNGNRFSMVQNVDVWWNPRLIYDSKNDCIWADANENHLVQIKLNDNKVEKKDYPEIKSLFETSSGLFFYNNQFLSRFIDNGFVKIEDPFINIARGENIMAMELDKNKQTLSYIQDNTVHLSVKLPDGNIHSYDKLLSALGNNLIKGNEFIDFYKQFIRVTTDRGVMVFDTKFSSAFKKNTAPVVSFVKLLNEDEKIIFFPYHNNSLWFDEGSKDLQLKFGIEASQYDIVEYRYRMQPLEEWSAWSDKALAFYTQLKGGNYQFELQGRVNGRKSETFVLTLHIERMWYQTYWLILPIILVILLWMLGIVLIMSHINRKKMAKQRNRYKQKDAQKTVIMKNEQLLQYTEIISHKNEFLNEVKAGLEKMRSNEAQRWVNKISNEVNNEKKEFLFHKLFSEIHQDFISRITAKYPELTSNDIRLLSFIRINLENREIANLMNISGKSVETSRYRLRKKLVLQHEDDLNHFVRKF